MLDYALYRVGVVPDYHLPSVTEGPDSDPQPRFTLLKLHGSINWGVCNKCRELLVMKFDKPSHPLWFPRQRCAGCGEQLYSPLLVPPSWDKTDHRDMLRPVWAKAVDELRAAKRVCVIGYSMPKSDAFFTYLLGLALAENDRLTDLIVVDKGPAVQARWEELLEPMFAKRRMEFHPEGLVDHLTAWDTPGRFGRGEVLKDRTVAVPASKVLLPSAAP